MEISQGANQEKNAIPNRLRSLQETVINSGRFSEVRYVGTGASGVTFRVTDRDSKTPALLKMAADTTPTSDLLNEFNLAAGRHSFVGLNQIASYPAAEVPANTVIKPTMRGLSNIRNGQEIFYIGGGHQAILLEWLEEAKEGEPGYHRLDKLIAAKSKTWTDLEILEIIAPFAYLLAETHKKGVVYNDIGADKADHLYYDETKHQLKVIDWANMVDMHRASYDGSRKPYQDVEGLVQLIYRMRTGADPLRNKDFKDAKVLRSNLVRDKHLELAALVELCLVTKKITDGSNLYKVIEFFINSFREKSRQQPIIGANPPPPVTPDTPPAVIPARPPIHITNPDRNRIRIERKPN